MVVSEIHFQKTTSESLTCDLTFCFVSILNIWSVRPAIGWLALVQVTKPPPRTLQRENLLVWVHDRRVRRNWAAEDIVGVRKVDDDDLVLLIDLLSYTDEVVRFEGQTLWSG